MLFGYASARYLLLVAACAALVVTAISVGGPAVLGAAFIASGLLTTLVVATAPRS